MIRRAISIVAVLGLCFVVVSPAVGGSTKVAGCGVKPFSYAGLQADDTAHGVAATLTTTATPLVADGHVGGWIGLGGTKAGPGGEAEWLQAGFASFATEGTSEMYYEVALPGSKPQYVELASAVAPGVKHHFAVLEMSGRTDWWRVWVDGQPVSPAIHLPGSGGSWYPQAVAENWNGGTGACNLYSYRFTDVTLAQANGGVWRPLKQSLVFQDTGYHVVSLSSSPRDFLAASL